MKVVYANNILLRLEDLLTEIALQRFMNGRKATHISVAQDEYEQIQKALQSLNLIDDKSDEIRYKGYLIKVED